MRKNSGAFETLDAFGLDAVCDLLIEGATMTAIAAKVGVDKARLTNWCHDPQRSARVAEARAKAALYWDEMATDVLEAAQDPFELSRAKEIAHHYRWRASKIAPKVYGDKVTQEHSGPDGGPIIVSTGVPTK